MYFTRTDGSQNIFFYQPALDTLELTKYKDIDHVFSWKLKKIYTSKLKPLYTAFLHCINLSGYRMGIKFDRGSLAVEQNNYATKIANAYIVYELDAWSRNPTNYFKFKNCLLVRLV